MKNLNDIVHCLGVSPSRFLSSGSREHGWSVVRGGFLSLAMALTLAACTADNGMDIVGGEAEMPVAFSAYTSSAVTRGAGSPATRGISVSPSDLQTQGIGVFAFYQKAKSNGYPVNFNKYTGEPTFMYNQKVAYDTLTSSWDYTPHKYWPNNTNDQLSFFAYAPYDVTTAWEDLQLVTNLKGDKFTRHYIIEDEVEDQQDYLWADPIINQLKPTVASALQFNFRHLCAKIGFSLATNNGTTAAGTATAWTDATSTITINSIVVKGIYTDFDYVITWDGSAWNSNMANVTGSQDITLSDANGNFQNNIVSTTTYTTAAYRQLNTESSWLMIAPQTGLNIVLTYTVTTTDGTSQYTVPNVFTTHLDTNIESSKAYIIKFLLAPEQVDVSADVVDWTSSGDINAYIS